MYDYEITQIISPNEFNYTAIIFNDDKYYMDIYFREFLRSFYKDKYCNEVIFYTKRDWVNLYDTFRQKGILVKDF